MVSASLGTRRGSNFPTHLFIIVHQYQISLALFIGTSAVVAAVSQDSLWLLDGHHKQWCPKSYRAGISCHKVYIQQETDHADVEYEDVPTYDQVRPSLSMFPNADSCVKGKHRTPHRYSYVSKEKRIRSCQGS